MILLTDTLRLILAKSLIQALAELYPNLTITNQEIYSQLTSPPNPNLGHLTLGGFLIAKKIKVDSKLVATSLQQKLGSSVPGIKSIDVLNAYLNFKFETKTLAESVISPILIQL